jgi:hypothetical protein
MMIPLSQQERKRVFFWEDILKFACVTSQLRETQEIERCSSVSSDDVNPIDIGDNLRNLMRLPKISRCGWELKGINLWQQFQM